MRAVFRADASAHLGGGHVMRCLALAAELKNSGWTCVFATRRGTRETVPALDRSGMPVTVLDRADNDEAAALRDRWPDGVDWLIVDHYERDAGFERACRPWARRVMAIDDVVGRPHGCDVLLDQTLGRRREDYEALVPVVCHTLLGPGYALLRPEFMAARAGALQRRATRSGAGRIMVSFGLTDPHRLAERARHGIARAGIDAEVEVADGSADAGEMADAMSRADIAIGAAGGTSWERCCLGLPSVLVVVAENQRMIADALANAGAATVIGWYEDVAADDIARALRALVDDGARRRRMSESAARVCDGLGAARVREVLEAL